MKGLIILAFSKQELGSLIKTSRAIKSDKTNEKYTQKNLSDDIGISTSYLCDIEAGRKYPNYVLLNKIADACEVSLGFYSNSNEEIDNFIKKNWPDFNTINKGQISLFYRIHLYTCSNLDYYVNNFYKAFLKDSNLIFNDWRIKFPKLLKVNSAININQQTISVFSKVQYQGIYKNPNMLIEELPVPYDLDVANKYTGLLVPDDSMRSSGIKKNDIVIYQENIEVEDITTVDSNVTNPEHLGNNNSSANANSYYFSKNKALIIDGDLVVVSINGKDVFIRRYFRYKNIVELKKESGDPKDKSELFDINTMKTLNKINIKESEKNYFQILGKIVKAMINL